LLAQGCDLRRLGDDGLVLGADYRVFLFEKSVALIEYGLGNEGPTGPLL
jgi:hypothetical protein